MVACVPKAKRRGFSLLEMVMVLIAIAFAGAIAAPRFASASARYRCDAAAARIAADLRYCQATARSTGVARSITFNSNYMSYQISALTSLDNTSTTYTVNLANEPYRAVIRSAAIGNGTVLSFDIYGTPSSAATLVIACGSFTHTITLEASSGAVTVQ
jgi:prepilin-type N-terminal cleavage/methylation domain-containing protein